MCVAIPGPKTNLDAELFGEIKAHVFAGRNLKEMAEISEIPISTLYTWHSDNYLGIADKIEGWRRDNKLEKADRNIDKILDLDPSDKDFIKSVADISKFVKETLDKPHYSKRTELGGIDGKDLQINVVSYADHPSSQLLSTSIPIAVTESNG